ncbi:TRAP transporter large permease subunit [Cellulosilyticum sp. I15G10I2]|uniref:TRAP transporter large permease subunit n=1 Tax=Cellulosilyticum sp. I15G10I2 TaxID=1892843 RepID=UPI000B16E54B|nr:TRAP transporter large permease subunit [Cellulosilyticum sp. I15G10I2]
MEVLIAFKDAFFGILMPLIILGEIYLGFATPTEAAAVQILTPLFLPIMIDIGINPIHFGVIMIVNLAIGMLTPPFGLNLFVASGISKMSISEVIKGTLPFIAFLLFTLMVITFVPQMSLLLIK